MALRILGFQTLPGAEELRRRYRELLFQHHPDFCASVEAHLQTANIVRAYRYLQQALLDRTGKQVADESILQLIETENDRIALPVDRVLGFVRASETEVFRSFLSIVARYRGDSYILHGPAGQSIATLKCSGWFLLVSGSHRCGLVFARQPSRMMFTSADEGMLLSGKEGRTAFMFRGQQYNFPVSLNP